MDFDRCDRSGELGIGLRIVLGDAGFRLPVLGGFMVSGFKSGDVFEA